MHTPVLLKETIKILNPKPGEFFIDGTLGAGGHSRAILEKIGARGKLLAIDLDSSAVDAFSKSEHKLNGNAIFVKENYANLKLIMRKHNLLRADGLVLDVGFSSDQLEKSGRGFSFKEKAGEEPLDMRYDTSGRTLTAADALNTMSEKELTELFFRYGEEKLSRRIAREIVSLRQKRRIIAVRDLVPAVEAAVPRRGRIHPATKVFQALRIYVNRELENLSALLRDLPEIINSGGRVAIITFHSLEDRAVKRAFRDYAKDGKVVLLTKKPVAPSEAEILQNPRSRSAKLRAIEFNSNPKPQNDKS